VTSQISNPVFLQVEALTKAFGNVVANDHVNLDVRRGEIHCLLGENGAGKTTLAECLFGYYRPDSGTIRVRGQALRLSSPHDAIAARIGMVHQHFVLARRMSAVENIVVGTQTRGLALNLEAAERRVQGLCDRYGLGLDLRAPVRHLSVGEQQWVEILKALYLEAELLILDEPTAVLTPQESDDLLKAISEMRTQGLAVILITHKLREVMGFTDRVTVLRQGRVVRTVETARVSREELVEMMVGRSLSPRRREPASTSGEPILELRELSALGDDGGEALRGLTLGVRRGEIVGLAGVAGNGQAELYDVILGVRHVADGQVVIHGKDLTNASPASVMAQGVGSIPPDRIRQGLLMGFPIKLSLILGLHNTPPFRRGMALDYRAVDRFSRESIREYQVMAENGDQTTNTLSGGNLQRLILARELAQKPNVLIASSPTRGLDVAATEYVHQKLIELRDSGVGVLLISEDLDEILAVSDRVAIIYRGRILGEVSGADATRSQVGLLMAGFEGRG